jgi:hypothetical protein
VTFSAPSISAIVDGPSVTLVYTTLAQTLPTVIVANSPSTGYRITSAVAGAGNVPPFNNGGTPYASNAYDNTLDITGTQELQVSNGKFTTPGGQTYAYTNYSGTYYTATLTNSVNYNSANIPATGYRYATFSWKLGGSSGTLYKGLEFRLYNTSGVSIINNLAYAGSYPIQLYYRLEDTASSAPTNGTNFSSAWINGNSLDTSVNPAAGSGTYYKPTTYTDTPYSGLQATTANIGGYTKFPVYILPVNVTTQNINIYCRIGIPMNVSFSFQYIAAVVSYSPL